MYIYMGVRKFEPFKCQKSENPGIHLHSFLKKGFIIYLTALKKGGIWHAHTDYVIYIYIYFNPV